jgi:hypothetical protein
MIKLLLAVTLTSLVLSGCTAPEHAYTVLESQGYTDISINAPGLASMLACSEDDTFRAPFVAKSPTGASVRGTVCSGLLKGSTVRFQ